jgi:hypothetical protein
MLYIAHIVNLEKNLNKVECPNPTYPSHTASHQRNFPAAIPDDLPTGMFLPP